MSKKEKFENLLKPGKIGSLKLKNRIIMAPIATNYAGPQGEISQRLIKYYKERAKGGAALITTGSAYIMPDYSIGQVTGNHIGIYKDSQIADLGELADAIKENGAKAAIQIFHGGRQARYKTPISFSDIPYTDVPSGKKVRVRKLNIEEIEGLEEAFAIAALRAKLAGFDAVNLHFANGYLGSESLSPKYNNRDDIYGGSTENRMRFCLNIIRRTKEKVGDDFPVYCRVSTQEFVDEGLTLEESKVIIKEFEKAGMVGIDLSSGVGESVKHAMPPACMPRGFASSDAAEIKKELNIPVIIAGRINDPFLAEEILREQKADFIAMGRALIADPHLPKKVVVGIPEDIKMCTACNECRKRVIDKLHLRCAINPIAGREIEHGNIRHVQKAKKIIIVGAGPAGMEAARICALRGHDVVLYEKTNELGGGQLRLAMTPPHKGEFKNIVSYYSNQLKKMSNLKLIFNKEATAELILKQNPDTVIIATGAEPLIPDIPGIERNIVCSYHEVLSSKKKIAGEVVIMGGGRVGCEVASFLGSSCEKVTIIEMLSEIGGDMEVATLFCLKEDLGRNNVNVLTNKKAIAITDEVVVAVDKNWNETRIKADAVILALGAKSVNGLKDKLIRIKELHVIGDAKEPRKIMDAIFEGFSAGNGV